MARNGKAQAETDTRTGLVQGSALRITRQGKPYIAFTLQTCEGPISCKVWNVDPNNLPFGDGDVIQATGSWDTYEGAASMIVTEATKSRIPPEAFYPTYRDLQEISNRFSLILRNLRGPLGSIVRDVLQHEDNRTFFEAPAASSNHHARVGGLLKHTLNVCLTAESLAARQPSVNCDLVVAGAILHDVGKVREYERKPPFKRTVDGRLKGHIAMGLEILRERTDAELRTRISHEYLALEHIILSHHGKLEWGSPVEPQTAEALIVFHADYADAYAEAACEALALPRSEDWTPPVPILGGRTLYAPKEK